MATPKGPLNPSQLSVQQLSFLTKQLEEENQVLTSNFQQLKMAQQKFTVSAGVVGSLATEKKGKEILVPLTESLYVPGELDPEELVLVDIGTSFFVGKTPGAAKEMLLKKAALLQRNTETLYKVITEKREHLDVVAETLQAKTNAGGGQ